MKKLMIAASMALAIFTLTSCEQEEIQDPITPSRIIKEKPLIQKTGGGEEEDPIIIYGITENTSSAPIVGAKVVVYDSGTSNPMDTTYSDTQGAFQSEQDSGMYYFVVTANNYTPLTSSSMSFPASNPVTLVLQQ